MTTHVSREEFQRRLDSYLRDRLDREGLDVSLSKQWSDDIALAFYANGFTMVETRGVVV